MTNVKRIAGILLLVAACGAPHRALAAAPLVVGNGTPASCTDAALQNALITASTIGGADIRFACGPDPFTIPLQTTTVRTIDGFDYPVYLVAPNHTSIDGGGLITLAGGTGDRKLLFVDVDVAFTLRNLTILATQSSVNYGALTISNATFPASGGIVTNLTIDNRGTLTIHNDSFVNPMGEYFSTPRIVNSGIATVDHALLKDNLDVGAMINSGTLEVRKSVFYHNLSNIGSASIRNDAGGILVVDGCDFLNNSTDKFGSGAIDNEKDGRAFVRNSEFDDNRGSSGGAITNGGLLDVKNSRFSGNASSMGFGSPGGGAINNTGTLSIDHSTFSGNHAELSYGGYGGAIYNAGTLTMTNSLVTLNVALVAGGGIYSTETASLTLVRTNVVGNTPDDIWPIQ